VSIATVVSIGTISVSCDVRTNGRDVCENIGGSSTVLIMMIIVTDFDVMVAFLDTRFNFK